MTEKMKFVKGWVEIIVGKGENAGSPAFSPFPSMFSKGFYFKVVQKSGLYCKEEGVLHGKFTHHAISKLLACTLNMYIIVFWHPFIYVDHNVEFCFIQISQIRLKYA